jgi:hypothetical protein
VGYISAAMNYRSHSTAGPLEISRARRSDMPVPAYALTYTELDLNRVLRLFLRLELGNNKLGFSTLKHGGTASIYN